MERRKRGSNLITIYLELELENFVNHYAGLAKISKENLVKTILLKKWKIHYIKDKSLKDYEEFLNQLSTPNYVKRDDNIKTENKKLQEQVQDLKTKLTLQNKNHEIELQNAQNYAKIASVSVKNTELKNVNHEANQTKKDIDIEDLINSRNTTIENMKKDLTKFRATAMLNEDLEPMYWFVSLGDSYLSKKKLTELFHYDYDREILKLGGKVEPFDIDVMLAEVGYVCEFRDKQKNEKGWIHKVKKT